ncbi:MAG: DUF2243 domain-containing protein [Aeromicrobium sp.]
MGTGFGGFVDGIALHQLFQWHHMISRQEATTTVAGLEMDRSLRQPRAVTGPDGGRVVE